MSEFPLTHWPQETLTPLNSTPPPPPPPPQAVRLFDIEHPDSDPNELLQFRFLCRGGGMLLIGPTGAGKSSFCMQAMILWALGRPFLGIKPKRAIKSLLVQAENDDFDIVEMRDGVVAGMNLTQDEINMIRENILVVREDSRTQNQFVFEVLRPMLEEHRPDLVWIDPALAYLGGESNSQSDVGGFLRNMINPLLRAFNCAAIIVHHVNKPPSKQDRTNRQGGDFAYAGSGSAEWANWARAVLVIRSIGHDDIYELRAGKRGRRLGWKNENGEPTTRKYIGWTKSRDQIFWQQVDGAEAEAIRKQSKAGSHPKLELTEILHCIATAEGRNQAFYKKWASRVLDCSSSSIQERIRQCEERGWLEVETEGQQKRYKLSAEGREAMAKAPSSHNWTDHRPEIGK